MKSNTPSTLTVEPDSNDGHYMKEADVENAPAGRFGAKDGMPAMEIKEKKNDANVTVEAAGTHKSWRQMNEIERTGYLSDVVETGEKKYHKLGWVQLVVVLIVEAIALGSLSLPK